MGSGDVIRVLFRVSNGGKFFLTCPSVVSFIDEEPGPGINPHHTIVQHPFERVELGDGSSAGSGGHIGPIVVMGEGKPFLSHSLKIVVGLGGSFTPDMLGDKECSDTSLHLEVSFSPSDFQHPVVGMETFSRDVLEQVASPQVGIVM